MREVVVNLAKENDLNGLMREKEDGEVMEDDRRFEDVIGTETVAAMDMMPAATVALRRRLS